MATWGNIPPAIFRSAWTFVAVLALLTVLAFGRAVAAAESPATENVEFSRDIKPILAENCYQCHGPDAAQRQADLRLDTFAGATSEQGAGPAVVPGDAAASALVDRIESPDPDVRMPPPESKLTLDSRQKELLRQWIDAGAAYQEHWAFVAPRKERVNRERHPIDELVERTLQRRGLRLAPEAPRHTLIRRVTLDLTGLPPTPEAVASFLEDQSATAYESLVDRLLAQPAYGERMAWDWLDAARYADSNGYQGDRERTMWPWRDWVVQAFNDNLPFDQFTVWQLAGDLLPEPTLSQQLATGFCRNHPINGEGGRIPEENRVDYVMDMTETMGTTWLGLTLNCCRCHDHKFDPITQREYYQLTAYFNQTPVDGSGGDPQQAPVLAISSPDRQLELQQLNAEIETLELETNNLAQQLGLRQAEWEKAQLQSANPEDGNRSADHKPAAGDDQENRAEEWRAALAIAPDQRSAEQAEQITVAHRNSNSDYRRLNQKLELAITRRDELDLAIPKVMVMADRPESRPTFVLVRGLYNQPGEEVARGVPGFLPPMSSDLPANRLGLARWLVSPDNPLTARVVVNRFWQQLFGIGLAKTSEDFGSQGEIPPQRELLDWLAADFRDNDWNVKALMRLIVTSRTYRQSARARVDDQGVSSYDVDPDNRWLARGPRFRLPSWMLRDQALAASGLLVSEIGGPSVNPYQPPGVWEETSFGNKKYVQDHGTKLYRRSIYTFWRRIAAPTMFFDNAGRQVCSVKPLRTNTPLHALATLNDVTFVEAARMLAEKTLQAETDDTARLQLVYRRLLARDPQSWESRWLLEDLEHTRAVYRAHIEQADQLLGVGDSARDLQLDTAEHASWAALCLALLNLDETVTKP